MKRSEINKYYRRAKACFETNGWALPPNPKWDITDFGLGDLEAHGLTLINLAEEPEYCEKLMFAAKGQTTPMHTHAKKKEDIICRKGTLALELHKGKPSEVEGCIFDLKVNGEVQSFKSGDTLTLQSGERVTLVPGIYHAFYPITEDCIIGEVSTANDDLNDNFFINPDIGRFPGIEEDEPVEVKLLSEYS